MSEGIKKMLAERAALETLRKKETDATAYVPKREAAWQKLVDEMFVMIKRAAPFIDEGHADPSRWLPSDMLRITYSVAATCENNAVARVYAFRFVHAMLERARKLYLSGFHPNPWSESEIEKIPLDLDEPA